MRKKIFRCLCIFIGGVSAAHAQINPLCTPIYSTYMWTLQPIIEKNCGECHGAIPKFGAPISLIDYESILVGDHGNRPVDRMATRLANYTMPPAGANHILKRLERNMLVDWASCGQKYSDHSLDLEVNRPRHIPAKLANPQLQTMNLVANKFVVKPQHKNFYQCFIFQMPSDEDVYITRIDPIIDNTNVLHHIVVMDTQETGAITAKQCAYSFGTIYYGWAPNSGGIELPDGGINVRAKRIMVQAHYNNSMELENMVDSSGIRIHVTDKVENEYAVIPFGPIIPNINLKPGAKGKATSICTMNQDAELFMGAPHMHSTGSEFYETIIKKDTKTEISLIDLTGWDFNSHFHYEYNVKVQKGDAIKLECVFDNQTTDVVKGGLRSEDEMCLDYIYAKPASATATCSERWLGF